MRIFICDKYFRFFLNKGYSGEFTDKVSVITQRRTVGQTLSILRWRYDPCLRMSVTYLQAKQ